MDCIFCKIRDKIIPKEFVYEDKDLMVFPDIHPYKPVHLLVVPKKHIKDFLMINDKGLITKMIKIAQKMIKKFHLENKGYRLVANGGGAQFIDHLHVHLLGPLSKTAEM